MTIYPFFYTQYSLHWTYRQTDRQIDRIGIGMLMWNKKGGFFETQYSIIIQPNGRYIHYTVLHIYHLIDYTKLSHCSERLDIMVKI